MLLLVASRGAPVQEVSLNFTAAANQGREWYGIGGLSGGGATSTFLYAYAHGAREDMLDLLFKPRYAASFNILKVEIGSDDQTTDGCEACHMRTASEVNCSRGYEWDLMKAARQRNPAVALYGLPWAFPGWLGFGQPHNPYTNVSETARYISTWLTCARDTHGVPVDYIGLWNECPWTADYVLALRHRLDTDGHSTVKIVAPDGDMQAYAKAMASNTSLASATFALGAHYPGASGTTVAERHLGLPLFSSEDYSTFSDATGGGCWGRLLVQNANWGLTMTVSWYLVSSFSRGMSYTGDGMIRAEWPASGHYELAPPLWYTAHWTLFATPHEWAVAPCHGGFQNACQLRDGGNYAVLVATSGPEAGNLTVVVETLTHQSSKCIRRDPPGIWNVSQTQRIRLRLDDVPRVPASFHVYRSCVSWRYPASDDGYMVQLPSVAVQPPGVVDFIVDRDCYYTLTTLTGRQRPPGVPSGAVRPSAAFPLPYDDDFEGAAVGGEAAYFGDQQGKYELVPARGGRHGTAMQQQVVPPYPVSCPWCPHSTPITIIGDMFYSRAHVEADVLLAAQPSSAGVGLNIREPASYFRGAANGTFFVLSTGSSPGGLRWALCLDSLCNSTLTAGSLERAGAESWHRLVLEVDAGLATAYVDGERVLSNRCVGKACSGHGECSSSVIHTDKVLAGGDIQHFPLSAADPRLCRAACCNTTQCQAWGMDGPDNPECWLKDARAKAQPKAPGERQVACGYRPTPSSYSPPTGWAGLLSSWDHVQFDNFKLSTLPDRPAPASVHRSPAESPSAAVFGSGSVQPRDASQGGDVTRDSWRLVSAPCDEPGIVRAWNVSVDADVVRLRNQPDTCITANISTGVHATGCEQGSSLVAYDAPTGRIMLPGGGGCIGTDLTRNSSAFPGLTVGACGALPANTQQFHYHPGTGSLRAKASNCIIPFADTSLDYRDCCLALAAS